MKQIEGNLIEMMKKGKFDVVVHGCNCWHTMGSGFAKKVATHFPEVLDADLRTSLGDMRKLGTFSTARVSRFLVPFDILNAYTQYTYSRTEQKVEYVAVRQAFRNVWEQYRGARIAYPLIGAGTGGGDWDKIAAIIDEELHGMDHTLVVYQPYR